MNAKDVLVAIVEEHTPKEKESAKEDHRGCKRESGDCQTNSYENKRRDDKTSRMVKFTPLVMLVDKTLMQIKDNHHLK